MAAAGPGGLCRLNGAGRVTSGGPGARFRPALQALLGHFDQQWAMHKLWEDGLAEVATYDAERTVYQKKRRFEFVQITVKEEFNQ